MTRKNPAERFWAKVRPEPDGCWEWAGSLVKGYGRFGLPNGKQGYIVYAHRFSWELHYGPIPDGMCVLHNCQNRGQPRDNPRCVRPDHLFLGTQQENQADKIAKGMQVKGESVKHSKLTEAQVLAIRSEFTTKRGCAGLLAKKYGVGRRQISRIVHRQRWNHVPEAPSAGV